MAEKRLSIKLNFDEFREVLKKVFGIRLMTTEDLKHFLREREIKVEKAVKEDFVDVQALRVYLPELKKEVDQTIERGEKPCLKVKLTEREKTGEPEVELVFMGTMKDRHVEELSYWRKDPMSWTTWGLLVLTLKQARKLSAVLEKMIDRQTIGPVGS